MFKVTRNVTSPIWHLPFSIDWLGSQHNLEFAIVFFKFKKSITYIRLMRSLDAFYQTCSSLDCTWYVRFTRDWCQHWCSQSYITDPIWHHIVPFGTATGLGMKLLSQFLPLRYFPSFSYSYKTDHLNATAVMLGNYAASRRNMNMM